VNIVSGMASFGFRNHVVNVAIVSDEAIKAFKELAQFERPPAEIAAATAETLAVKLRESFYNSSDVTDIIDLKGEPQTDSVRSWIQKGLTQFQTRDIRQILSTMALAGMFI
jgi:hypothetical protein